MRVRLNSRRINESYRKPLLNSTVPVKCPFCNKLQTDGKALRKHVSAIHQQV